MKPIRDVLEARPWAWSFIGAAMLWLATLAVAGAQAAFNIALSALSFGALMALVGLGQMLVVTTGPGNIDLSIPAAIGLTGAVALRAMGGEDGALATGIGVALLLGVAIGLSNYALIRLLQIAPIIATMSSAFILQSLAIHSGQGIKITPPELLAEFATGWLLRLPLLAWAVMLLPLVLAWILARTLFGRHLSALGQNARAAWLAGISVERIHCLCYVLCAVCAALLLYFTNTLLNVVGLSAGGRSVLTGVIIIAVIVLSARRRQYR